MTSPAEPTQAPTLWFEVEDILRYFERHAHPTGIQRVAMEILTAARPRAGARIRFCRLSARSGRIEPLDVADVEAAWSRPPPASFGERVARWCWHGPGQYVRDRLVARRQDAAFARLVRPGDILVCVGSPMLDRRHSAAVAAAKRRHGLRYALLIHDILPAVQPALFNAPLVRQFCAWLGEVVAVADLILTSSRHGRQTILDYGRQQGWPMPPVERIRFGSGFRDLTDPFAGPQDALPDRFVLFVATIEIRKNHRLLVNVWRRLIERHGAAAVPALVLVGRIGWKIRDLMAELDASHFLDGKIVLHAGISDAALRRAYDACLFTVYPSLAEGWGLPVAESLVHGKLCIASDRTSLPEVGGDLADYIDPEDEDGALAAIERALFEPGYLAAKEARIRDAYRPPGWDDCVDDLIAAIDRSGQRDPLHRDADQTAADRTADRA